MRGAPEAVAEAWRGLKRRVRYARHIWRETDVSTGHDVRPGVEDPALMAWVMRVSVAFAIGDVVYVVLKLL